MASRMAIQNASIITPYQIVDGEAHLQDEKILKITPRRSSVEKNCSIFSCKFRYIAPSFIELHLHGAGDADSMYGTPEAVITTARKHLSHGTTSLMPTTLTGTMDNVNRSLEAYTEASFAPPMPSFSGMHLEDPYFSMAQRGAQDPRPISLLKLIHKVKGTAHMCLISDSLGAAGLGEDEFLRGGLDSSQTTIVEDGVAKLPDRSAFAAGDQLIQTMHKDVGIPLEDGVRMMSINPARIVRFVARKGEIAPSFVADFVIFNQDIVTDMFL